MSYKDSYKVHHDGVKIMEKAWAEGKTMQEVQALLDEHYKNNEGPQQQDVDHVHS